MAMSIDPLRSDGLEPGQVGGAAGRAWPKIHPDAASSNSVDSNFRGTGIAYVYGRFKFKEGKFNGDPRIRIIARGRKPIDPRDGVQRWTINSINHAYDLLIKPKRLGGIGRSVDEMDVAAWQAGADLGEELVATREFTAPHEPPNLDQSASLSERSGSRLPIWRCRQGLCR